MLKVCEQCGDTFEAKNSKVRFCNKDHYACCPICGKSYVMKRSQLGHPPTCCSWSCRSKLTEIRSMKKYGCKAPGNNPESRKKASETMMKKLGVPYAMMSPEVQQKSKETLQEKYGVDNISKNPEYKMKAVETSIQKYGKLAFNLQESYDKQHRTIFEQYGVNSAFEIPHVQQSSDTRISRLNLETKDKIEKLGYPCELEYNIKDTYYDIHIKDTPYLIELNPTQTNSCYAQEDSGYYDKYYHRNRSILAETAGMMCIHIWDWDNLTKILGSIIKTKTHSIDEFKIYKLTDTVANQFLSLNDLRGPVKVKALHLGLVKDDEVYQCISFTTSKYNANYKYHLIRYTQKLWHEIPRGFDVLSSNASLHFDITNCISYMDYSKPYNQAFLEEMGMQYKYMTPPTRIYSKGQKFYTQNLVNKQYNTTESIDENNGWSPIFTTGSKVYTFES